MKMDFLIILVVIWGTWFLNQGIKSLHPPKTQTPQALELTKKDLCKDKVKLKGFCVDQDEAMHYAEKRAVSRKVAAQSCKEVGGRLPTNKEWSIIATEIAQDPRNWVNEELGTEIKPLDRHYIGDFVIKNIMKGRHEWVSDRAKYKWPKKYDMSVVELMYKVQMEGVAALNKNSKDIFHIPNWNNLIDLLFYSESKDRLSTELYGQTNGGFGYLQLSGGHLGVVRGGRQKLDHLRGIFTVKVVDLNRLSYDIGYRCVYDR